MKLIGIKLDKSKANYKISLREKRLKSSKTFNKIFGLQKFNSYI